MPFFSIITVTRNNRAGFRRTRESVEAQSFKDYQWIIIDAVSNDGSAEDFETCDALVVCEPDEGPYDGMNKGLDLAIGEYVIFMNAGDCFAYAETLQRINTAAASAKPDFMYGDAWETEGTQMSYKPARSHLKPGSGMFTHHQAMLYRRIAVRELRYNLTYQIAADYDFTLRFLNRSSSVLKLPFAVCVFTSGGLSQIRVALGRSEQFRIRRVLGNISLFSNAAIYVIQTLTWTLRRCAPGLYWRIRQVFGKTSR